MKLRDAVVVVTGANRGLGAAIVRVAVEKGARRVYAGARNVEQLATLVKSAPDRIVPVAIDITDKRSLAAAAKVAEGATMLVNNAGVLASYNVLTSTDEQIAQEFSTNFFGTLAATKAFLPALEAAGAKGGAALVNVLSVVSLASMPSLGAYSASKAASYSITQALRFDLGKKGIRVHAAFPGAIDTDMVKSFDMPKTSPESVARELLDGVEAGQEEIVTDVMSRDMFAKYKRDPKELQLQLAAMSG